MKLKTCAKSKKCRKKKGTCVLPGRTPALGNYYAGFKCRGDGDCFCYRPCKVPKSCRKKGGVCLAPAVHEIPAGWRKSGICDRKGGCLCYIPTPTTSPIPTTTYPTTPYRTSSRPSTYPISRQPSTYSTYRPPFTYPTSRPPSTYPTTPYPTSHQPFTYSTSHQPSTYPTTPYPTSRQPPTPHPTTPYPSTPYPTTESSRGIVTSPNYPNSYPNNVDVTTPITVTSGYRIKISFLAINIETSGCSSGSSSTWQSTSGAWQQGGIKLLDACLCLLKNIYDGLQYFFANENCAQGSLS